MGHVTTTAHCPACPAEKNQMPKPYCQNTLRTHISIYRAEKKSLQILLSSTQAGPGRKVKQEQEEISRNHVPRLFLGSVCTMSNNPLPREPDFI